MKILYLFIISALVLSFSKKDNTYTSVEETQTTPLSESIERGKVIYNEFCIRCHKASGEGHKKFYPPLAKSDWLTNKRSESIRAVKYGLKGAIVVNGQSFKKSMSNPGLENNEIADVMNYIMNNWGNTQVKVVTIEEVDIVSKSN